MAKDYKLKKQSKFAAESEAKSDTVLAPSMAVALFGGEEAQATEFEGKEFKRLNLPTLLKPSQVPIWTPEHPVVLRGTVVKVCDSPNTTIKGKLLWLKCANGTEVTFPCTGVIRNALAPGVKDDSDKLDAALNEYVGKELVFRRNPDKENGKFKKSMFMFDVLMGSK